MQTHKNVQRILMGTHKKKEERSEIQPKWPGVYEMAEVRFGSCAAL